MVARQDLVNNLVHRVESGILRRPFIIGMTLTRDMIHRDVFKQASAMAYVTLLSLVPSLVAIFCVLSLFAPMMSGKANLVDVLREFILSNLASGTGESAVAYLDGMIASLDLATIGWSSFASVLVSLILLLRQIEEALNHIWLIKKPRNIFTRFMYFWTFMTLGMIAIGITIGVTGFNIKKYLEATSARTESNALLNFALAYGISFVFFFVLYKIVPNCKVSTRAAALGAGISALILGVAGWGYGVFVSNASNYRTLYGALAQLPLFLMWLYICWIIILFGAVLSWRFQEGYRLSQEGSDASALEADKTPLAGWRNLQLRAMLPKVCLLAIYKNFQAGSGKGISPQDLGHQLNLPSDWITSAMETLESLGFVVAAKGESDNDLLSMDGAPESFFPAFPADKLDMKRIDESLQTPRNEWIEAWLPEMPADMGIMLRKVTTETKQDETMTVAKVITG
jgi:membrane protein